MGKNLGQGTPKFAIAAYKSAENCRHHDDRVMGHLASITVARRKTGRLSVQATRWLKSKINIKQHEEP
jgi:hypothetical protein